MKIRQPTMSRSSARKIACFLIVLFLIGQILLVSTRLSLLLQASMVLVQDEPFVSRIDLLRFESSNPPPRIIQHNITIMVDMRAGWKDWGFSFFESNQLQLYGRHFYHTEWFHFLDDSKRLESLANASLQSTPSRFLKGTKRRSTTTCILVSNPKGLEEIRKKHAPHCATWIINDELCKFSGDIRHYYKGNDEELFVPLGPRFDFHQAYLELQQQQQHLTRRSMLKSSERPYVFNAIFSKSTSNSRKILKPMLLTNPKYNSSKEYFIQIPWRWQRKMGSLHVNSSQYVQILGKSQFTLSPNGHNPECFRFWESLIMGSIPILVLDQEYQDHACPNSLYPVWEHLFRNTNVDENVKFQPIKHVKILQDHSPFIILENWTQLESVMQSLLNEGDEALNQRQERLIKWYADFMRESVWKVEDYLLT